MKKILQVILLLTILLVIAGCSGVQEEKSSEEAPSLTNILNLKSDRAYKADYIYYTTGLEEDVSGEMSVYINDPNERLDGKLELEGQKMEGRTYIKDKEYSFCNKQDNEWQCFTISLGDFKDSSVGMAAMNKVTDMESGVKQEEYLPRFEGTKQIAGTTAYCWIVESKQTNMESNICYSEGGILLYAKVNNKDHSAIMEAQEFSRDVTEADFELPAEPMDIAAKFQEETGVDLSNMDADDLDPVNMPGLG